MALKKAFTLQFQGCYLTMEKGFAEELSRGKIGLTLSIKSMNTSKFYMFLSANHNLSRAFWGQKKELTKNSERRMEKYLNKDKKDLSKLRYFLGKGNNY